jgi:hypothetical protein
LVKNNTVKAENYRYGNEQRQIWRSHTGAVGAGLKKLARMQQALLIEQSPVKAGGIQIILKTSFSHRFTQINTDKTLCFVMLAYNQKGDQ